MKSLVGLICRPRFFVQINDGGQKKKKISEMYVAAAADLRLLLLQETTGVHGLNKKEDSDRIGKRKRFPHTRGGQTRNRIRGLIDYFCSTLLGLNRGWGLFVIEQGGMEEDEPSDFQLP